jgi:quinol monooxygenase YgiN
MSAWREGFHHTFSMMEEAAFDAHAELPHMKKFLGLVAELITHPVQAMRCRRLG